MIISFSGHRPVKLGGYNTPNSTYNWVKEQLRNILQELKPEKCISGMALGTDTWAAEICIDMNIPFIAALPFKGHGNRWPKASQDIHAEILTKAAEVVTVCDEMSYKAFLVRDEWMVDHGDELVAVYDGSGGGTGHTVGYAKKVGKTIHIIDPKDMPL